jgi:glycopeptide antibiotics resistance protein
MSPDKPDYSVSSRRSATPLSRWATQITLTAGLLVMVLTLFPFDFAPHGIHLPSTIRSFLSASSTLPDVAGNVGLLIPFGVGMAAWTRQRGRGLVVAVGLAWVASTALSLTVEILQLWLPSRYSSAIDIFTNSTGGLLGGLGYVLWSVAVDGRSQIWRSRLRQLLSVRYLTVALMTWVLVIALVTLGLRSGTQIKWDPSFPLNLGNFPGGEAPWQGTIANVSLFDRALTPAEITALPPTAPPQPALTAHYALTGSDGNHDQTGNLPDLIVQSNLAGQSPTGIGLGTTHWLSTEGPTPGLTERVRQTSQLTLRAIVTTADLKQPGLAPIISLANDAEYSNFTLAQSQSDLVFRLRTQVTGWGGGYLPLIVPNFFTDQQPHQVVVTYQAPVMTLFADGTQRATLALTPEITLFRYLWLIKRWTQYPTAWSLALYEELYYLGCWLPFGVLLGILLTRLKGKLSLYTGWILGGMALPAVLLEVLLRSGETVRLERMLLSVAMIGIVAIVTKMRCRVWLR